MKDESCYYLYAFYLLTEVIPMTITELIPMTKTELILIAKAELIPMTQAELIPMTNNWFTYAYVFNP